MHGTVHIPQAQRVYSRNWWILMNHISDFSLTVGWSDGNDILWSIQATLFSLLLHNLVDQYNEKHASMDRKALLHWYEADDDSESECIPKRKNKRETSNRLVLLTPLMACANQEIQRASENVLCDSTASLDRFNTSFCPLPVLHLVYIPLAKIPTSDEREHTIQRAFEMVKEILPPWFWQWTEYWSRGIHDRWQLFWTNSY